MPDAVFGGSWSNGMPFLLTVIPISSSRSLGLLAGDPERRDVDEHEVVVRPARDDPRAQAGKGLCQDTGVGHRPALVLAEALLRRQLERDGLAGDDVHERTTLDAREDRLVDGSAEESLESREVGRVQLRRQLASREDEPAARAAQRLVRGGRDDVGMREGTGVEARRHESGDVGHVHEQDRADAVGDVGHPLEIESPRIGARSADDQLRPDLPGLCAHRVVVDLLRVLADAVGMDLVAAGR